MNHSLISRQAFALCSILLFGTSLAQAQLGESEQAIRRRFGRPTATEPETSSEKTLTFETPGILTVVDLRDGKCVGVSMTKIEDPLTPSEVQRFLHENSQGKTWNHDDKYHDVWTRSDGIIAYVTTGFITIVPPVEEHPSASLQIGAPAPAPAPTPTAPNDGVAVPPAKDGK